MANSKTVSLRIPSELLSRVDQLAEEKYSSHKGVPNRSLVILDAIVAYCDTLSDSAKKECSIAPSRIVTIEQFQSLEEVVHSLAEELNELKSKIIAVSDNAVTADSMSSKSEEEVESVDKSKKMPMPMQLPIQQTEATIFDLEDLQGSPQIPPLSSSVFAKRLKKFSHLKIPSSGVQLSKIKSRLGEGFWEWIKEQDPDNIKWQYRERKGNQRAGYVPEGDLSDEQKSNLLNWIQENL